MKTSNIVILLLSILLLSFGCRKDIVLTDPGAKPDFSTDTVMFDTIFTTIGSTTKQFKIYNRNTQPINISQIYLANAGKSPFRLNIDGIRATSLKNIEIPADDSLFVFVEVTLDPNNTNNPLAIIDSVVFKTNGNTQDVKLVAFGQDCHLFLIRNNRDSVVTLETQTWNDDKPYLIYNKIFIAENHTLTINPGVKIYFHRNAGLYAAGELNVFGTKDKPVEFRHDRLEKDYSDIPSQWNGILLFSGPVIHTIEYAEIKNAVIGLQVGTLENIENGHVELILKNTKIENMSYACLFAISSKIQAYNSVFSNAGFYSAALVAGGNYSFYHSTMANYWRATRTEPSVVITNNLNVDNTLILGDLDKAYFGNCIIYGSNPTELGLSNDKGAVFNYKFDYCLLKTDNTINTSDINFFNGIIKNSDPKFKSTYEGLDFSLDTLSPAKDKGNIDVINLSPLPALLQFDIKGISRGNYPDIGAYERTE